MATVTVEIGDYELSVLTDCGPRVIGFRRHQGTQVFADLPDLVLEHPGIPDYALRGGHRLWRAPEIPALTYEPDDSPVSIEEKQGMIVMDGPPESDGLVKRISVATRGRFVVVTHTFHNAGTSPFSCAPWAITQMVRDGLAILPQRTEAVDPEGVQPNRFLVLWPYTDPGAPEITWGPDLVVVAGSSDPAPLKLGQANHRGWLAYAVGGELFVKWGPLHDPERSYLDMAATMQVYRNDRFVELETMGYPVRLEPGSSINHQETWAVFEIGDVGPKSIATTIASLDLPVVPGS